MEQREIRRISSRPIQRFRFYSPLHTSSQLTQDTPHQHELPNDFPRDGATSTHGSSRKDDNSESEGNKTHRTHAGIDTALTAKLREVSPSQAQQEAGLQGERLGVHLLETEVRLTAVERMFTELQFRRSSRSERFRSGILWEEPEDDSNS